MPILAYTKKMLEAVDQNPSIGGNNRQLFERFIQAIGRQIRRPYHKRHSAEVSAQHLGEVFSSFSASSPGDISLTAQIQGRLLVITSVMADQPFIVDTLRMRLQAHGAVNIAGFNGVISVRRDEDGGLVEIGNPGDRLESVIRLEAEGIDVSRLETVLGELREGLNLARSMVQDFHAMTDLVEAATFRLSRMADSYPDQGEAHRETGEFLRWLLADNFVFMGIVQDKTSLGFAQGSMNLSWPIDNLVQWADPEADLPVRVRKGLLESPVHRAGRIDEIRVELPDKDGCRVLGGSQGSLGGRKT